MNELLAPIYYTFANDKIPDFSRPLCAASVGLTLKENAEADSFFCFTNLMALFRDHFCQPLDKTTVGIQATLGKLSGLVRAHDVQLATHLVCVFGCAT